MLAARAADPNRTAIDGQAYEQASVMINSGDRTLRSDVDLDRPISRRRYRRVLIWAVVAVSGVAILPLLILARINYDQYQSALSNELTRPMLRFATSGKQAVESFLTERLSALGMVVRETSFAELRNSERLDSLLAALNETFGEIVDLGVIDSTGIQVSYAGPFELEGRNYRDHAWFREVGARGVYVSDVFMGYRNRPHIVIAIQEDINPDSWFVLRATIDTDVFHFLVRDRALRYQDQGTTCGGCHTLGVPPSSDAFMINRDGVLQTPSRFYGYDLERSPLPSLPYSTEPELIELEDDRGEPLIVSYARIEHSPFTLIVLSPKVAMHAGWLALRSDLIAFLVISSLLIVAVVVAGSTYVVRRARDADLQRAALYHKMEYTNKLAAIGRLGAGVAHEINNPLSIITEKAGLLKDLLTKLSTAPPKEKLVDLVDSVLRSAERCGGITHRLLGFAKQLDVGREPINLDLLLKEVLGFLEKEASYRSVHITFDYPDTPPTVVSDRGQLQQVFLNIVNNAFAAVETGGHIEIGIRPIENGTVAVSIADDGVGIPEDHLAHIFDPFFTTKKGAGTGLGLSITYGIVQKLGGQIAVTSEVGHGTCFTVTLPIGEEPT